MWGCRETPNPGDWGGAEELPGIPWAGGSEVRPNAAANGALCIPCCEVPSLGAGGGRRLSSASLTYFVPAGDKGGLCGSAHAEEAWDVSVGGHRHSPSWLSLQDLLPGPLHPNAPGRI